MFGTLQHALRRTSFRTRRTYCQIPSDEDDVGLEIARGYYGTYEKALKGIHSSSFDPSLQNTLYANSLQNALFICRSPPIHFNEERQRWDVRFDECYEMEMQPSWLTYNILYNFVRTESFLMLGKGPTQLMTAPIEMEGETINTCVGYSSEDTFKTFTTEDPTSDFSTYNRYELTGVGLGGLLSTYTDLGLLLDHGVRGMSVLFPSRSLSQLPGVIDEYRLQASLIYLCLADSGLGHVEALNRSGYWMWTRSEQNEQGQEVLHIGDPIGFSGNHDFFVLTTDNVPLLCGRHFKKGPSACQGPVIFTSEDLALRFILKFHEKYFAEDMTIPEIKKLPGDQLWKYVTDFKEGAIVDPEFASEGLGIFVSPDQRWLKTLNAYNEKNN